MRLDVRKLATMLIREATAADWPGIFAIVEPVIRAGETYTIDTDSTEDALRSWWLSELEPGASAVRVQRCFVVTEETGGTSPPMIVATAMLHPNYGGAASKVAHAGFMVHPHHEGKGYGRLLAHHVLNSAFADGYHAMVFNAVVESNVGAVHLWQSLGFAVLATIPDAFEHPTLGPVGLHIMHRHLAD